MNPSSHDYPSPAMLACVSHAPIILIRARAPEVEPEIMTLTEEVKQRIAAFDPEQIVFFGNDHFAGFHYANMPPYCIGAEAEAVGDLGGFAGKLKVPSEAAIDLVAYLRDQDFDPSISYRMRVDHAFSQPLHRLTGALDRYPVIPVFMSVFTPPFVRLSRSRRLGEAIGRWAAQSGKRTLFIGTGGLSHHPAHYFPMLGQATPDVHGYQLDGDRGGTMTDDEWFERFERMHLQGAISLSSGARTAKDVRLNPELDRTILQNLVDDRLSEMDDWDQARLMEEAGVGILEIHTWIAATAAYRSAGNARPLRSYYAEVIEYGGGYGMLAST